MRVRMLHQISGARSGTNWPAPGGEIDLPDAEAVTVISIGMAEAVAAPKKVENATPPKAEETRAEAPKPSAKPRGRPRKAAPKVER